MNIGYLRSLAVVINILKLACLLCIFLLAYSFLTNFIDNPGQYPLLVKINQIVEQLSQPLTQEIKHLMPYKINGVDYSKIILIIPIFILMNFLSWSRYKVKAKILQVREKEDYFRWRERMAKNLPKEKVSELDSKFSELNTSTRDRKELLREFVALKNQLDSMGQNLAFLAIDVVDSTGMKRDEDKHLAAYAFENYNQIVAECLKENGVIKYAMTPDGIMSCFKTTDNAVKAATDLIAKLKTFNQSKKQIKRDFEVRCGVNAGFVYIDDDTPLEQVSDRVIDIAGHMQKHAKPNGINIAGSAIEPLINREGFHATTNVIDEQIVYEWSNKEEV